MIYPPVIITWKILTTEASYLTVEQMNVSPLPERDGFSGLPVSLRKKEHVDLLSVAILQNRAHQFGETQFLSWTSIAETVDVFKTKTR